MSTDLNNAKQSWIELMQSLNKTDQQKFLTFIAKEWNLQPSADYDDTGEDPFAMLSPYSVLTSIARDIKKKVPFDAILTSENIITPSTGENSDCKPNITLHVDEFLYNDRDLNELMDNGQVQRYYCVDCGSKNLKPLILISHSMSQDGLYYIFTALLPPLKDKTILDIGSRLGAVLYGAHLYTEAKRIIGVEMNEEFCNLQNEIIRAYKMDDRISILNKRIEEVPEIIKQSDVIIINNAFEFYFPKDVQIDVWKFLKTTIKSGTLLVTRPSIETTFKTLSIEISVEKWLKPFKNPYDFSFSECNDEFSKILCYEVL